MCLLTAILQEVPTGEEEEDEIYSQRSKLCARFESLVLASARYAQVSFQGWRVEREGPWKFPAAAPSGTPGLILGIDPLM